MKLEEQFPKLHFWKGLVSKYASAKDIQEHCLSKHIARKVIIDFGLSDLETNALLEELGL